MHIHDHIQESLKTFGRPYAEVHAFLDSYYDKYRGLAHRRLLHHRLGVELVARRFGEQARQAAEQHIRQDFGSLLPEDWVQCEEFVFLLNDEESEQEQDLIALFGHDVYREVMQKHEF